MKLLFNLSFIILLTSCQKSFDEGMPGHTTGSTSRLSSTPTSCLSQSSAEMLLIMHKPSVNYYFVLKNPDGSDSIKQFIFTPADIIPGAAIKGKGIFPETNLMAISATKDIYQTIPGTVQLSDPITPYFYHDGDDIQSPQMGVASIGAASGRYTERNNQIRPGEVLIYKLGSVPQSAGLKMYGLKLFLRIPQNTANSQTSLIELYNDNTLVNTWRPPLDINAKSSIGYYELVLPKTQVFNEIRFRSPFVLNTAIQYAVRGARTNDIGYDPLMFAQATAPRFLLTPEFPDLLYLVGSSSQRKATATGGDDSQEFATNGSSTGPTYLNFSTTGSGASFAIDPIGRYGVVSAAEPAVSITTNKPLTLTTGTAFYSNSNMSTAFLRLQNAGPIGTQATIEMLTAGDVLVGSPQTTTFTATGQFKQITLDPGSTFKKIRLTVPGGAPANSAFVLNPSPPTTSPYQALTRFYPSCN